MVSTISSINIVLVWFERIATIQWKAIKHNEMFKFNRNDLDGTLLQPVICTLQSVSVSANAELMGF